jgi:hypothetical protein
VTVVQPISVVSPNNSYSDDSMTLTAKDVDSLLKKQAASSLVIVKKNTSVPVKIVDSGATPYILSAIGVILALIGLGKIF